MSETKKRPQMGRNYHLIKEILSCSYLRKYLDHVFYETQVGFQF